jgi:hypothetical protein
MHTDILTRFLLFPAAECSSLCPLWHYVSPKDRLSNLSPANASNTSKSCVSTHCLCLPAHAHAHMIFPRPNAQWQWVREAHRGAHKSDVWQPGQEVQDNNDGLLLRLPVGDGSHIRWTRHGRQGPENSIRLTRPCRDQAIAVESVIVFKSSVKNHMSVW